MTETFPSHHKCESRFVDWDAVDRAAERGLAVDPWDVELNLELGHACRERDYLDVARFAYECAREVAPHRADIAKYLAELSSRPHGNS